jgi:hypothetical protein
MSQPPHPPHQHEPYSGRPASGTPEGYPPPGGGYSPPPPPPPAAPGYGTSAQPGFPGAQPAFPGDAQQPAFPGAQPSFPAAQPAFPGGPQQPGYGGPQFGAPAPKKKSSALKIVLIVAAVMAVLCVGGVAVAVFAARDTVGKVVDAASITVVQPETLGGRAKVTDPTVTSSLSSLDAELAKVPGATGSVSGLYGDVPKQDLVMVAAASSITGSPQERFDQFLSGMTSGGMQLTNLADTDPGPLGGIAKCGDSGTSGVEMAVCVWSDNGSIGMFAMLFKEKAELEKEFVSMRGQVEQKS